MDKLLLHVDELFIKGKNRFQFLHNLHNHLQEIHSKTTLLKEIVTFCMDITSLVDSSAVIERLQRIPGINCLYLGRMLERNFELLRSEVLNGFEERGWVQGEYNIEIVRSDKLYSLTGPELSKELAFALREKFPQLKVNFKVKERTLYVRVLREFFFVSFEKFEGLKGLPIDTKERALTFLSGGFDSAYASLVMSSRGLAQDFIFFHGGGLVDRSIQQKVMDVALELSSFQKKCQLLVVPFASLQQWIVHNIEEKNRVLFLRSLFFKTARALDNYDAFITGDVLGQVASQTLSNLQLMNEVSEERLVLRPLVGMNKNEIINQLRLRGGEKLSKLCAQECRDLCSSLEGKSPSTKMGKKTWKKLIHFKSEEVDQLLNKAIKEIDRVHFSYGRITRGV